MSVSVSRGSPVTSPWELPCWPSCVDGIMTVLTDDKRFSSPSRHTLYPGGFFWPSFNVEVSELTDMVNFDVLLAPAHFTRLCEESFDQFAACAVKHAWNLIM
jgi:hypothetical protein